MKQKLKIVSILIITILLSLFVISCGKKSASNEKVIEETKNENILKDSNEGDLVYDDIDISNIMYFENTNEYLIKDIKKEHSFIVYIPDYEGIAVKIYDNDNNEIENSIKRYSEEHNDIRINKNIYTVYLNEGTYNEELEYKMILPNDDSYFLIKDFEQINTLSFEIECEEKEEISFKGNIDFDNIFQSKEDVKDLTIGEIAIVNENGKYVPYKLEENNSYTEITKFSDIYNEVNINKTINLADYYKINQKEMNNVIKESLLGSGLLDKLIMTTYASEIGAGAKIGENDILVNVDEKGNFKIKVIINVEKGNEINVIINCKIVPKFKMLFAETKKMDDLLSMKNLDFSIELTINELNIVNKINILSNENENDTENNIINNVFDNDVYEGYHNAKSWSLIPPATIPIGTTGFFAQVTLPLMAGYKIAGEVTQNLTMPFKITVGVKKDNKKNQLNPYYNFDYTMKYKSEARAYGSFFVGFGVKGTVFAINENILRVSVGGDNGINGYGDLKFDIELEDRKNSSVFNTRMNIDGKVKVTYDVIIYAEGILSAENIPIINLILKNPIKGRVENIIFSKIIIENESNIASYSTTNTELLSLGKGEKKVGVPFIYIYIEYDFNEKKYVLKKSDYYLTNEERVNGWVNYTIGKFGGVSIQHSNFMKNENGESAKEQIVEILKTVQENTSKEIQNRFKESFTEYQNSNDYEKFEKAYINSINYCIDLAINSIENAFEKTEKGKTVSVRLYSGGASMGETIEENDSFITINDENGSFSRIICKPKITINGVSNEVKAKIFN